MSVESTDQKKKKVDLGALRKSNLGRCCIVDTWKAGLELNIRLSPEDAALEITSLKDGC